MGLISKSHGAKLVELEWWKLGKAVVRENDRTSIYLLRDIGGPIERYETSSLVHINYGLVQSTSTRVGTVVFLDEVIREAGNAMHDQMMKSEEKYEVVVNPEDTALEIGTMEVKIQDMTATRKYTLNQDRMKSVEGETGPYLQYAHVRLTSISRKSPTLIPPMFPRSHRPPLSTPTHAILHCS
ncbi:hypothetical protein CVT25_006794 [Psilocybe cyanescens]|uniref:Arginyl-tRNA synthetase catalytic core domain-containing protein n=1 Tax=Psilocybe cyanescens TaxID=93625 RepID=A0A409WYF9_PSICY|nr:hypothetical protein CVT25_006794 [Psilocybe cyanescens]